MNNKKNILEVDFSLIKRVLLRVDFNIPIDISNRKISDASRISASIPTIKYLLQQGCAILICSHFGRPNGNYVEEFKLDIIGLMSIPPFDKDPKPYFIKMKELSNNLNLKEISMGMSNDYLEAIKQGSTFIRIGSKIFGARD